MKEVLSALSDTACNFQANLTVCRTWRISRRYLGKECRQGGSGGGGVCQAQEVRSDNVTSEVVRELRESRS